MTATMKEDAELDEIILSGRTIRMTLSEILLACDALQPIQEVFRLYRPNQNRDNQGTRVINFPPSLQEPAAMPSLRGTKRRRAEREEHKHECLVKDSHMVPCRPRSFVSSSLDDVFSEVCDSSMSPLTDCFLH